MDLEGNWRLEEQIDSSVSFLYGAHFWPRVKNAVLAEADATSTLLPSTIRAIAQKVGAAERVDASLVLGIAAVGLMMLRQVGFERLDRSKDTKAAAPLLPKDPGEGRRAARTEERGWSLHVPQGCEPAVGCPVG